MYVYLYIHMYIHIYIYITPRKFRRICRSKTVCCGVLEAMMRWHADDGEHPSDTSYIVVSCAVCCGLLRCVAVFCSVQWCIAVCCSVLQCDAVRCSAMQCEVLRLRQWCAGKQRAWKRKTPVKNHLDICKMFLPIVVSPSSLEVYDPQWSASGQPFCSGAVPNTFLGGPRRRAPPGMVWPHGTQPFRSGTKRRSTTFHFNCLFFPHKPDVDFCPQIQVRFQDKIYNQICKNDVQFE